MLISPTHTHIFIYIYEFNPPRGACRILITISVDFVRFLSQPISFLVFIFVLPRFALLCFFLLVFVGALAYSFVRHLKSAYKFTKITTKIHKSRTLNTKTLPLYCQLIKNLRVFCGLCKLRLLH